MSCLFNTAENASSFDPAYISDETACKTNDPDVSIAVKKVHVVNNNGIDLIPELNHCIHSDSAKSTNLSTSFGDSSKQFLRPVPKPRMSLQNCRLCDVQNTASARHSESTLPSTTYSCSSELQDVIELSENDSSSVLGHEMVENNPLASTDKLSSTERKVAVVVSFTPSVDRVDESSSEPCEKEKLVTSFLDDNKDKIPSSQHSPVPSPLPRSPKLNDTRCPTVGESALYLEASQLACNDTRFTPGKPPALSPDKVMLPTDDGRDSNALLFGVLPVPGVAALSAPGDAYFPPTVSCTVTSVSASGPYIPMNKAPSSHFTKNLFRPTLAHEGREPASDALVFSPLSPLSENYSEEEYEESSLYLTEPLYQFYTDRVLAFNVLEAVDCTSDDEDDSIYVSVESVAVRFKSVIDKMSIGRDLDDLTKLSSTLFNIAKTCAGPGARRLWADVPKVKDCGILGTMSSCEQKLQECLFEIITSETSYVKSLDIVLSHFMKSFHDDPVIALSREDFHFLFSNLKAVVEAAHKMYTAVEVVWYENCVINPTRLCSVIEKVADEIADVYIAYCRNAVYQERKQKELNKNPEFVSALASLENSPQAHGLTLLSFLVLPMQRVTRMPMLLDAVRHRMSSLKAGEGSRVSGEVAVQSCLEAMQQIATKCNEAARLNQNLEQLSVIHKSLKFKKHVKTVPIVSSGRFLVKKGELTEVKPDNAHAPRTSVYQKLMRTVKNVKDTCTRHLFLFNNLLLIAKKKKDQFEVIFHTPVNEVVGAVELTDEEKARRLPHGAPSGCQNLFLLTIVTDAGLEDHLLACKQSSDTTRWIEAFTASVNDIQEKKLYTDCPQVQVVMRFVPSEPDELELLENDVINVIRKCPDGWFLGERLRDGKRGWFPKANTIEIENQHVRIRNLRRQLRMQRPSHSNEVVDPDRSPSNRVKKLLDIRTSMPSTDGGSCYSSVSKSASPRICGSHPDALQLLLDCHRVSVETSGCIRIKNRLEGSRVLSRDSTVQLRRKYERHAELPLERTAVLME